MVKITEQNDAVRKSEPLCKNKLVKTTNKLVISDFCLGCFNF